MKLADLRPCDGCGGPLFTPPGRWFQVVRTTPALLGPSAVEILAAADRSGIPLQDLDATRAGDSVIVMGDRDPRQLAELLLCVDCYHTQPIAELVRRRQECVEDMVAQGSIS